MTISSPGSSAASTQRSERFHHWRMIKDRIAHWSIGIGGVSVILAVVLIFFYLLFVVFPLFLPADMEAREYDSGESVTRSDWQADSTRYLSVEEQKQVGLRLSDRGVAEFFSINDFAAKSSQQLPIGEGVTVTTTEDAGFGTGVVATGLDNGEVLLFQHQYRTNYDNGVENRTIEAELIYPYGESLRNLGLGNAVHELAVSDTDTALLIAAVDVDGNLALESNSKEQNFLTGDVTLQRTLQQAQVDFQVTGLDFSFNQRWLYLSDDQGQVHMYGLPGLEALQTVKVSDQAITASQMLLGGISLLVGDANGTITQLFPVRDENNEYSLHIVRSFDEQEYPILKIVPEQRRKGFVSLDEAGNVGLYNTTANQIVEKQQLSELAESIQLAISPRADGLLVVQGQQAGFWDIDNEHPEISFSSLWGKVWYENYSEPQYVWQSSASTNDFEPKFSLTPLAFGTIKAALYAMLFAVPLALMGAAYTAYFMAPGMRKMVKPTIEIMEALPTVILGFLAGLWFAPFVENNLAGIFSLLVIVPVGLLLFAYLWSVYGPSIKDRIPDGWQPALLVPMILILLWLAFVLADPIQNLFFDGDLRTWISQDLGISYDQRNAMVVGFAMGFAVIPTIFSIAEDAIFGVPKSLSNGSLALGATPWQSLVRVVLPTASPGIFSALMIGLGRAVGETMIVLMATGNTPVMDWNIFEGMRTLSANIAVEMPESEVGSSHYRILFLAALVLFMFTFIVNTGAEIIRQRLRDKYSSL